MSEVPPGTSGDEASDEVRDGPATGEGVVEGVGGRAPGPEPGAPAAGPTGGAHPAPPVLDWWGHGADPSTGGAGQTPPTGQTLPTGQTPPTGTPPFGTPPFATPPFATPPFGTQTPGTPPPGAPPPGTPPWTAGGWVPGAPTWVGPAPWYAWGPGWPGGPSPQPPPTAPADRRPPLPWVVVGGVIAAIAMVAIGLGIGYSVWGGSAPAVARSGAAAPATRFARRPATRPATRFTTGVLPGAGRGGFLGVDIETGPAGSTGSSSGSSAAGAHVVGVVASSPAAKAGIVKGDTITELATRTVTSALALELDMVRYAPGQHVKVGWVTSTGKHESATVTLASRPKSGSVG